LIATLGRQRLNQRTHGGCENHGAALAIYPATLSKYCLGYFFVEELQSFISNYIT
jgi:hypothetical protein